MEDYPTLKIQSIEGFVKGLIFDIIVGDRVHRLEVADLVKVHPNHGLGQVRCAMISIDEQKCGQEFTHVPYAMLHDTEIMIISDPKNDKPQPPPSEYPIDIQVGKGLSIHITNEEGEGTVRWLHFKPEGKEALVRLSKLFPEHGGIVGQTILNWADERLKEYNDNLEEAKKHDPPQ